MSCVDARQVMLELYETHYGIYDHLANSAYRPMSSVAMHASEDYSADSLLEECIRTYRAKSVQQYFGLSLVEFMELPVDIVAMLLSEATDLQSKDSAQVDDIDRLMKK
jgi:hypothetical protein